MAGISTTAPLELENNYLFNGKLLNYKEFSNGAGLEWYSYGMREYDPQIGRFFRIDPLASKYTYLTPYQYASNNPITNIDIDGLEGMFFMKMFVNVSMKMHQWLNKEIDVSRYEATHNGKSMPIVVAKMKDEVGHKMLHDVSKIIKPVVENTQVNTYIKQKLPLETSVKFSAGTEGSKVAIGFPSGSADVGLDMKGEVKGNVEVANHKVIGNESTFPIDIDLGVPITPTTSTGINVKTNPKKIIQIYGSEEFKQQMNDIKSSNSIIYSPNITDFLYYFGY